MIAFKSETQRRLFYAVKAQLEGLGFSDSLLPENYQFVDWFKRGEPRRTVQLAAFAQQPTTYESACHAVVLQNGVQGVDLVSQCRALGAPFVFEVGEDVVGAWTIRKDLTLEDQWRVIRLEEIPSVFREHADRFSARSILRAKNIGIDDEERQVDFFDLGFITALEHQIREKLHRLLNQALKRSLQVLDKEWQDLSEQEVKGLFRLVFRFLAAKVLHDRDVDVFSSMTSSTPPSEVLREVQRYYDQHEQVFDDPDVWEAVHSTLWGRLSFQNLSVEVLAYIYEYTLVSDPLRQEFGIHGTPSSIARYIVRNLPIGDLPVEQRMILEPCSGHGIFLVAALQQLRSLRGDGLDAQEQHNYFLRMLRGIEIDEFSIEVSKLCLILADFPNTNSWQIHQGDVFDSPTFPAAVNQARVILCNPPFEDFTPEERGEYGALRSDHKPAELLYRVLDNLHPEAMLGFVLPRHFLDGAGYRDIRRKIAERFDDIEVVALPDDVFYISRTETSLLLAKRQKAHVEQTRVSFVEVADEDRRAFLTAHAFTRRSVGSKSPEEAASSLVIPALEGVWEHLATRPKLRSELTSHRGIEWQRFQESECFSESPRPGYLPGFGRIKKSLQAFTPPVVEYLNVDPQNLRGGAINYAWEKPKLFSNAVRIRRRSWRIAAFVDHVGHICSQQFHAMWPTGDGLPLECLAAVLNGPVAAAFITSRERGRHIHIRTLNDIPLPILSPNDQLEVVRLVREYTARLAAPVVDILTAEREERNILLDIDAAVLKGYDLPPEIERRLLDYFRGSPRPVPFKFTAYPLDTFSRARVLASLNDLDAAWDDFNERRAYLIDKELSGGLTVDETNELQRLQDAADRYLDTIAPIRLEDLGWLEERMRNG